MQDSNGWKVACVVSDWQAIDAGQLSLRRGERVRIMQRLNGGFLVQKIRNSSPAGEQSPIEEGWVPSHSLAFASTVGISFLTMLCVRILYISALKHISFLDECFQWNSQETMVIQVSQAKFQCRQCCWIEKKS